MKKEDKMNPYADFINKYSKLMKEAKKLPLGGFEPLPSPQTSDEAPRVLHFSPHPDDECLMGALLLRLQRDMNMRVINVPMTFGSNKARQKERYQELIGACDYLGFEVLQIQENGLPNCKPKEKTENPEMWSSSVGKVASIIEDQQPFLIMIPHRGEFNTTHQGTNVMVFDALALQELDFSCYVAEWEYWTPLTEPNLLLEVSIEYLIDIITAVSFHVGELIRNPQHTNLPAWMQDNVRRGSELVGVPGGTAPQYQFATVYQLRKWQNGKIVDFLREGLFVDATGEISELFS
jgi:LmbE family N-acetylglucosaminyl deacetylase